MKHARVQGWITGPGEVPSEPKEPPQPEKESLGEREGAETWKCSSTCPNYGRWVKLYPRSPGIKPAKSLQTLGFGFYSTPDRISVLSVASEEWKNHVDSAEQGEEGVKLFCNMAAQMSPSFSPVTLDTTKTSFDSGLWNSRQPIASPNEWLNLKMRGAMSWKHRRVVI